MTFKELISESNAGEIANAKREQRVGDVRRKQESEVSSLKTLLIRSLGQLTGKRWDYGKNDWYGMTDFAYGNITNPGRLKGYKYTDNSSDRVKFLEALKSYLPKEIKFKDLDTTWGNMEVEYNGNTWEISYSGRGKADMRITPKTDLYKWADAEVPAL